MQRSRILSKPPRQGAAAVEFAMTAPLLFLILFGALELGHANMLFHTVEAAAYEGTRQGIVPGATAEDCLQAAQEILRTGGVRGADIRVTPFDLKIDTDTVSVQITVPYARNSIVAPLFTKSLIMQRGCELMREGL